MMVTSAADYYAAVQALMQRVVTTQGDGLARAADLIASALRAGGILQAFGTGHSEGVAMDFAGRAGGLVPTNRILLRDLVVFGGAAPEILHNEKLERDPQIAEQLYELAAPRPEDVFVVAS
jgi:uncharacterized phosphosugar-binding protein